GDGPTERGESFVPYSQVLPKYLSDAADSLTRLRLPPSTRGIVQNYFDALAAEEREVDRIERHAALAASIQDAGGRRLAGQPQLIRQALVRPLPDGHALPEAGLGL